MMSSREITMSSQSKLLAELVLHSSLALAPTLAEVEKIKR